LLQGNGAEKALTLAEALLEGLEEVKSAQQVAVETLNGMMQEVHKYKLNLLQRMREDIRILERVVQGALREISQSSAHPPVLPRAEIMALMDLSEVEQRCKLRFLTLTRSSTTPIELFLRKSIDILTSTQLPAPPCALEPPRYLPICTTSDFSISPFPFTSVQPVDIEGLPGNSLFTAWCFLPTGNFLATGSADSKCAFSIDYEQRFAIPLAETIDVHSMAGIVLADKRVYLLGGLKQSLETATVEMYDIYENSWLCLPDMLKPRSHFQPSRYLRFLYIFGGSNSSQSCERLDLDKYVFEEISVSISGRTYLTSYCSSGVFYLFNNGEIYSWEGAGEPRQCANGQDYRFLSLLSPVAVGETVYFFGMQQDEVHLLKFDLRELKLDWCFSVGEIAD